MAAILELKAVLQRFFDWVAIHLIDLTADHYFGEATTPTLKPSVSLSTV
jgi:hypothetical protein